MTTTVSGFRGRDYPDDVATFSAVTRQHVLNAIAEYDDRGAESFLGVYGFARSHGYDLVHEGKTYDSKAILGVAHRYATGRLATADDFTGGKVATGAILRRAGFEVSDLDEVVSAPVVRAPRAPRAAGAPRATAPARASTRRAAEPERVMPVCPTCYINLPATGICDSCG